jgi:hypothetical protein
MPTGTSLTAAWSRVRETVTTAVKSHRAKGYAVVVAYADNGTVRSAPNGPLTFVFTVPDDAATRIRQTLRPAAVSHTTVQYVDADGYRLYVLGIHQKDDSSIGFISGGITHRSLREHTDTIGQAETVVRSLTDTIAVKLQHRKRTPFLTELK